MKFRSRQEAMAWTRFAAAAYEANLGIQATMEADAMLEEYRKRAADPIDQVDIVLAIDLLRKWRSQVSAHWRGTKLWDDTEEFLRRVDELPKGGSR